MSLEEGVRKGEKVKIRTDFVTNSSSSSFVSIKINSKEFKELLEKYKIPYWKSTRDYDVVIEAEEMYQVNYADSVESLLEYYFSDCLYVTVPDLDQNFYKEFDENYDMYIDSIAKAEFEAYNNCYGEFGEGIESHCQFSYDSTIEAKIVTAANKGELESEEAPLEVHIPEGTEVILRNAFGDCNKIRKVVIPYGVKKIEQFAFSNCSILTEVEIPDSVEEIENNAFSSSRRVNPEIPESVIKGPYAFTGSLKEKEIEEDKLIIKHKAVVGLRGGRKDLVIPDGILGISGAFQGRRSIKKVHLPQGLISVNDDAFRGCANLEMVYFPESIEYIAPSAFAGCPKVTLLGVKATVVELHAKRHKLKFEALDKPRKKK